MINIAIRKMLIWGKDVIVLRKFPNDAFTVVQVEDEVLPLKLNVKPQLCNLLHSITKYKPSPSSLC